VVNKAGYKTRASYYAHIDNADLSFSILEKYARALNHDFSDLFPEMHPYKIDNEQAFSFTARPKTIEEAILQRDVLRDKYQELLEKYTKLLEQQAMSR